LIDLIIIVILSAVLVPLAVFSSGVFRIALGLVFALFMPGYTLAAALFPRKTTIGGTERIALSFGLSITVVPIIVLLLNYTPWGIRVMPILISVLAFIVIMVIVAWYRRRRFAPEEKFRISLQVKPASLWHSLTSQRRWNRVLNVLLVIAILGAIGSLVYIVTTPKVGERFTEFSILGPEGKMENYPREVILGESASLIIGITNHEHQLETYNIAITIDGQKAGAVGPIVLENEGEWEEEVKFSPGEAGDNQKVEFCLFKDGESEPYRVLHLWIDVKEKGESILP